MSVNRVRAYRIGKDLQEQYGALSDDGTSALRITATTDVLATFLGCTAGYRGEGLSFDNTHDISEPRSPYRPQDPQGRRLSVEITPPFIDPDARLQAIAAYAAALFGLESPVTPLATLAAIPGTLRIYLSE
jgi:hypothetical protein